MFNRLHYQNSLVEAQELVYRLLEGDALEPDANLDPISYAASTVNAEQMARELGFKYEGINTADPKDKRAIWSKNFGDKQMRMTVGSDPTLVNVFVYKLARGQLRQKFFELLDINANQVREAIRELSTTQEGLDDEIPDLMGYATKAARKPWGYVLRSKSAHTDSTGKVWPSPYPWFNTRWSNASECCGNFRRYIGYATVYKRLSAAKQYSSMEVVPIYGDPRKYGDKVLDPNFVEPPSRHPRLESLDDEIRDLKAYAMQHGLPPRIKITFNRTTPESSEQGDYSESGWKDEEGVSMAPDELDREEGKTCVDLAVEYLWKEGASMESSSHFYPGNWYSTGWHTIDYQTGEEEEENYHLEGFTPEQERAIYDQLLARRRRH